MGPESRTGWLPARTTGATGVLKVQEGECGSESGGEQRGGPRAGGGSLCGCDWKAVACGQRLDDLLGWGGPG